LHSCSYPTVCGIFGAKPKSESRYTNIFEKFSDIEYTFLCIFVCIDISQFIFLITDETPEDLQLKLSEMELREREKEAASLPGLPFVAGCFTLSLFF